eukprot:scaffold32217_cov27-Tisochrysis_lutea.AAC.1
MEKEGECGRPSQRWRGFHAEGRESEGDVVRVPLSLGVADPHGSGVDWGNGTNWPAACSSHWNSLSQRRTDRKRKGEQPSPRGRKRRERTAHNRLLIGRMQTTKRGAHQGTRDVPASCRTYGGFGETRGGEKVHVGVLRAVPCSRKSQSLLCRMLEYLRGGDLTGSQCESRSDDQKWCNQLLVAQDCRNRDSLGTGADG